ncbi:hypothetical protein [Bradyrhizobium guangdongense]|uniref:hypothetical protein n=1 Tax=Bradyrhizobium guangdongense TaxID=1325090 RepID=UPI00131A3971|nr:hypothetical protein [Bradyrhizobium guangdongense]
MSDIEWYPADFVDEACPPSKRSPTEFVFFDGENWQLGYAPGDKSIMDDDREMNRIIKSGDVIEFMTCERLGDIEATIKRDGAMTFKGRVPSAYNVVIVDYDSDLLFENLEDLTRQLKEPDQFCNPSELIFEGDEETAEVVCSFANWSDPLPQLFEVVDGKPTFISVPAAKQ